MGYLVMPDSFARTFDFNSLPTLPSIAMEAIRLMEGDSSTFDSLADLLKNDQVLSGKIITYANSVHVGARSEISTIPQAISAAGLNAVRSIVLSVSIFDSFSKPEGNPDDKLIHFWMHSIGVACTAEILAHHLGFPNPDEAYLGGLLHDLGKIVSYQQFPQKFARLCHELEKHTSDSDQELLPLDIEEAVLGFNHIDAGKFVGERFGFPETLLRSMWLHHQPVIEPISPSPEQLPQLVRFADVLCVTHNVGSSYFLTKEPICHNHFHFALENLIRLHHLDPADIDEIMAKVHQRVEDVCTVLDVWDEDDYQNLLRLANVGLGKMSRQLDENNRDLFATNYILAATLDMHKKLHAGLSLTEAAEVIAETACQGFDVDRSLCLIRDPAVHRFVGAISDEHITHEIELPSRLHDMESRKNYATSDIEVEAANRLEQATHDLVHDRIEESRMFSMMGGSKFLATFFMADKKSSWRKEQLLGQLVVDFSSGPSHTGQDFSDLQKNFEALASSAGTAIERYLLAKDLNRQARKLAKTSRKMEENQRQLFTSHRLATVGRLAAGAAHEINNPLTIISLNIQILKRMIDQLPDNEKLEERLEVISTQEHRISQVIQNLMGFAKPTEPQFSPENIADIINKAITLTQGREGVSRITIENNTPKDLLPKIFIDPQQIEQVFLNLLVNAYQAMPKGGTLTIEATGSQDFVDILISDTGSGIAKQDLGKIFDPFFTTKLQGEGTGLGLAVCHAIIEHNQGTMTVDSKKGKGSTFKVRLPVDKSSKLRQMKQILKTKPQKISATATLQKCRVLVVDDELILNDILQETLRSAGYVTDGAYDGVDGLEKLRSAKYDVVLLDICMPRKDGLSVLTFIKKEYPEVQVIIITGLASMAEIKETVKKGAFACLKKPFILDKVLETLSRALKAVGKENKIPK